MKQPHIPSLTGLRFIAALTIAITHFTGGLGHSIYGVTTEVSPLGMPLFFTLSGFIIHYVYAHAFEGTWTKACSRFCIARIARLYPLFIFLFVYYALFVGSFGNSMVGNPTVGASYVTMTASWWYWLADGKSLTQHQYGHSWSVSTEVFFYVAYAIIIHRLSSIRSPRLCALILVAFCIVAYAALYAVFVWQDVWEAFALSQFPHFVSARDDQGNSFVEWFIYISPYVRLFEFIGGCLTCQMFLLIRRNSISVGRTANEALCWLGIAWILVLMACLYVSWFAEADFQWTERFLRFVNFLHKNFLLAPGCYLLILALALEKCWLAKVLSSTIAVFLGEISYSIYLAHPLVHVLAEMRQGFPNPVAGLIVMLMMTAAFAAGLYNVIELQGKRMLISFFHARLPRLAGGRREIPSAKSP